LVVALANMVLIDVSINGIIIPFLGEVNTKSFQTVGFTVGYAVCTSGGYVVVGLTSGVL